jgi:hypothetical protein
MIALLLLAGVAVAGIYAWNNQSGLSASASAPAQSAPSLGNSVPASISAVPASITPAQPMGPAYWPNAGSGPLTRCSPLIETLGVQTGRLLGADYGPAAYQVNLVPAGFNPASNAVVTEGPIPGGPMMRVISVPETSGESAGPVPASLYTSPSVGLS